MLLPTFYMRDGQVRLRAQINNVDKEIAREANLEIQISADSLKKIKNDFYNVTLEMMNAIEEILQTFEDNYVTVPTMEACRSIKNFIKVSHRGLRGADLSLMREYMNNILEVFISAPDNTFSLSNENFVRRDFRSRVNLSSQRDLNQETYINMFESVIANRPINLVDAAARNAANYITLKETLTEDKVINSYALNLMERQQLSYKEAGFDRIALGKMKGGTFSNEVFDVMLMSPSISIMKIGERIIEKNERDMIRDTAKLVRPGGVVLLTLPKFRFYKDVCVQIERYYKNLQIRRSTEYDVSHMLYIVGVKKTKEEQKEVDEEQYRNLRSIVSNNDIFSIDQEPFAPVHLPDAALEIAQFKGSVLNKDEVESIFRKSSCMNQFFRSQEYAHANKQTKEPLLPFTTGQLGLVLTSGSLDGVIDEGNGHYHVVKGRVVKDKQVESTNNTEEQEVTYTETIANRVEISIITADGTIKRLA